MDGARFHANVNIPSRVRESVQAYMNGMLQRSMIEFDANIERIRAYFPLGVVCPFYDIRRCT